MKTTNDATCPSCGVTFEEIDRLFGGHTTAEFLCAECGCRVEGMSETAVTYYLSAPDAKGDDD